MRHVRPVEPKGIEPSFQDCQSRVLPLDDGPVARTFFRRARGSRTLLTVDLESTRLPSPCALCTSAGHEGVEPSRRDLETRSPPWRMT